MQINKHKWTKPALATQYTQRKKATIHQITTMLSTSKNVLPGHNHLLTISTDDLTLSPEHKGHQHQWLAGGYDLQINIFRGG